MLIMICGGCFHAQALPDEDESQTQIVYYETAITVRASWSGWVGGGVCVLKTDPGLHALPAVSNLQDLEYESKVKKGIYQDLVNQMAAIDQRKAPHLQEIATAQAALDAIKKDAERTQAELEKTATDSAKAENAIRRADADLANTQQKLADVAERLNTLRRELQVTTRCRSMGMPGL